VVLPGEQAVSLVCKTMPAFIMSNRADAAPQEDSIGQRPIHRDALRGTEGEVESRDRTCDVRS